MNLGKDSDVPVVTVGPVVGPKLGPHLYNFQRMSRERLQALGQYGGRLAHQLDRAHEFTKREARKAVAIRNDNRKQFGPKLGPKLPPRVAPPVIVIIERES